MTCARCEELEAALAFYRAELGLARKDDRLVALQTRLGLTAREAYLFDVLHGANGRIMSRLHLDEIIPGSRADDSFLQTFAVQVHRIRKKLGFDAIETVWGKGWRITEAGRALAEPIYQPLEPVAA